MQHSGFSNGGLFSKANIFGGSKTPTSSKRPSTSGGSPSTQSEPEYYSSSRTSTFGRKSSLSTKSPKTSGLAHRGRNNHSTTFPTLSPERRANSTVPLSRGSSSAADGGLNVQEHEQQPRPANSFNQLAPELTTSPVSASAASDKSTTPFSKMLVRPGTSYQGNGGSNGVAPYQPMQPASPTLENITYQHIQETSSKRISTLDYLRKAHEGRVYWFNTLLFNKPDLQRMPYFDTRKLARRATNYLLLGLSLPTIIDLNASNPHEFLKTLNALLAEFEAYQQIHPADGSSSMSRARFPQMFKRATGANKGRRTSSAADIGLPMGNDSFDSKSAGTNSTTGGAGAAPVFLGETDLLPGEEYIYLLTPSLPFDPDFYETFATLCDVLIDCYTKLMSLVSSPKECNPTMAEMFTKADARVRKIIVQGVVKEFEDSSRAGVKQEVGNVGRVVLGGLM